MGGRRGSEGPSPRPSEKEGWMNRLPKRVLYRIALAGSSVMALVWF